MLGFLRANIAQLVWAVCILMLALVAIGTVSETAYAAQSNYASAHTVKPDGGTSW